MAEENGKGTFWKVIGLAGFALLAWMGTQLLAVPTHEYQIKAHGEQLTRHEARISEQERINAAQNAATAELIQLLREEAEARRKRGR
jgi:hypothetical protein